MRRFIAAAPPLLLLLLLLAAGAPARAARTLQQGSCPDLVPGGVEAPAGVAAGNSATVLAFEHVGPIYLAGAAEDVDGSNGPSTYSLELWDASDGTLAAGAASAGASGCATTPVVDFCTAAGGPAAVQVRLACLNADGRPCRVRVAAFMSPCPGGTPPAAVAVDGGKSSSGGSSGSDGGGGDASAGTAQPGDPAAEADGIRGAIKNLGSKDGSGVSTTTWIIVGAAAGAALIAVLLIWLCVRRCRRRRRQAADLESGAGYHPQPAGGLKPPRPQRQQHQQHQQFLVSNGTAPPAWQQQAPSPTKPPVPPPAGYMAGGAPAAPAPPLGAAAVAAAGPPSGPAFHPTWAFGYKVPARRDIFITDASKGSGSLLQRIGDVDTWLAAVVTAGRRWEGCILYNDDPPQTFPDGSPTEYVRPAPYRLCGHCKGIVLWDRRWVGWLVHSLPCWPCHDRSAPSGCATLSPVQQQQTDRGQSFLWVQLPVQLLPEVLAQVQHMQAFVYYRSDPRVWPYAPRDYTKSVGRGFRSVTLGDHLWHLAKANEPNDNFYREVAARFGGRWLVRSNLRGPGDPEPSSRAVLNISELSVPGWDHAPYKAGSEHAKMAVCVGMREGDRPPRPLVLVGDCNNTAPSHKRGGGGIVVQHPHLWEILRLMASEYGTP